MRPQAMDRVRRVEGSDFSAEKFTENNARLGSCTLIYNSPKPARSIGDRSLDVSLYLAILWIHNTFPAGLDFAEMKI